MSSLSQGPSSLLQGPGGQTHLGEHRVLARRDWDDAYRNAPYIKDGEQYSERWRQWAEQFRQQWPQAGGRLQLDIAYGLAARAQLDLFLPAGEPRGLVVFVHGGYWKAFDRKLWSHLAAGPLAHGFAVAMPSYTLCPDQRIAAISQQVAAAVLHAATLVPGPIALTGHSAGGQIVARLAATDSTITAAIAARLRTVVPISGVHDLRPLMRTEMNAILNIDEVEAKVESPVLLSPRPGLSVTAWVGGDERPEFIRQNMALAALWSGFDCSVWPVVEQGRNHFDVIEGLADADHPLTRAVVGPLNTVSARRA